MEPDWGAILGGIATIITAFFGGTAREKPIARAAAKQPSPTAAACQKHSDCANSRDLCQFTKHAPVPEWPQLQCTCWYRTDPVAASVFPFWPGKGDCGMSAPAARQDAGGLFGFLAIVGARRDTTAYSIRIPRLEVHL